MENSLFKNSQGSIMLMVIVAFVLSLAIGTTAAFLIQSEKLEPKTEVDGPVKLIVLPETPEDKDLAIATTKKINIIGPDGIVATSSLRENGSGQVSVENFTGDTSKLQLTIGDLSPSTKLTCSGSGSVFTCVAFYTAAARGLGGGSPSGGGTGSGGGGGGGGSGKLPGGGGGGNPAGQVSVFAEKEWGLWSTPDMSKIFQIEIGRIAPPESKKFDFKFGTTKGVFFGNYREEDRFYVKEYPPNNGWILQTQMGNPHIACTNTKNHTFSPGRVEFNIVDPSVSAICDVVNVQEADLSGVIYVTKELESPDDSPSAVFGFDYYKSYDINFNDDQPMEHFELHGGETKAIPVDDVKDYYFRIRETDKPDGWTLKDAACYFYNTTNRLSADSFAFKPLLGPGEEQRIDCFFKNGKLGGSKGL